MRWLGRLAPLLRVGFYYKAFHSPRWLFPFWESIIRHAAGLGRVNTAWRRQITPKWYEHADLLVIGAGPAGMQAALHAAEGGARVILVDENPHIGGSLDYQWVNDDLAASIRQRLKQAVSDHPGIRLMTRTLAAGWYTDQWLPLCNPRGIAKTRVKAVIVASGLIEQPAVFHNNDLPGVMLASAAQRLVARYAVRPCRRALLLVANSEGYQAALDMQRAGVEIVAVADLGIPGQHGPLVEELNALGVPVFARHMLYEAQGRDGVRGAVIAPVSADGKLDLAASRHFDCDGILMSVGWAPAAHLLYQAGGKLGYDAQLGQIVPRELPEGVFAAGGVNGVFGLAAQLEDARRAASDALAMLAGQEPGGNPATFRANSAHSHEWPIAEHPKGKNFVDLDEDLQLRDLLDAAAEGFDNIELIKRFSTVGMGPSQGKHANMNAIRVLARTLGQDIDSTGSTTARPFYHPQRLDHLAGRRFRVHRRSALQSQHEAAGAVFMEAGHWLRPEFYGDRAKREQMIRTEVNAVRESLGLIDVSTLGKIEVLGTDAARLLDAVYTMRMTNLKQGMTRYALAVDETGVIVDDGIVGRLGDDHFYVTTTTSHADASYRQLGRYIAEWGLSVRILNRTGQLAAMNLAGPYSRRLLSTLTELDLSEEAFPYLGIRETELAGIPVRMMRVGFVGELGYEIHAPYADAACLWQRLMEEGADYAIRPFGVEAQRRLRLEKGHIIVGQDSDGLTTPYEAGMPWSVHLKKPFFVGRQTLELLKPQTARQLVGFVLPKDYRGPELFECHLVIDSGDIRGRITSVAYSPTLEQVIGLVMLDKALVGIDRPLSIRASDGSLVQARQVATPFYDPDGLRQQADLPLKEAV
jgi:sarcosine oxidase subunit alpha